jgi:hypothetical protein
MRYNIVCLVIITLLSGCSTNKKDLQNRLSNYLNSLNVKGDKILLISLDDCSTCNVIFKKSCKTFVDEGGQVILLSNSRKKADLFLSLNHPNVHHDQLHEAKNKMLLKGMPVLYVLNEFKLDSIHIDEPEQILRKGVF